MKKIIPFLRATVFLLFISSSVKARGADKLWEKYSQGVYEEEDRIVVVTVLQITGKYPDYDRLEAVAKLKSYQYLTDWMVEKLNSPFFNALTKRLVDISSIPDMKVRVLFNASIGKSYRYIIAYPNSSLSLKVPRNWEELLAEKITNIRTEENFSKLADIMCELGAVEEALHYESLAWTKNKKRATFPQQLPELRQAAVLAEEDENYLLQMVLQLASINSSESVEALSRTAEISTQAAGETNDALREYAELCKLVARKKELEGSISWSIDKPFPIPEVQRCWGHSPAVNWNNGIEGKMLDHAKSLFFEGGDLGEIRRLLEKSINMAPRQGESWKFMGAAYVVEKKWGTALTILNQGMHFIPNDAQIKLNMSKCYSNMGYPNLSKGAAWAALLFSPSSSATYKSAESIIQK